MHVRIALMNFDAGMAVLAVEPAPVAVGSLNLRDLAAALSARGLRQIEVWIDPAVQLEAAAMRGVLEAEGACVREGRYDETVAPAGNRAFQRPDDPKSGRVQPACVFEASFDTLDGAVARAGVLVSLVRLVADLSPGLGRRLRFVVHELVANSADHAEFAERHPRIELSIVVNQSSTVLSYRDNGRPFATTTMPEVDINLKIARGERRGLGLSMLNRMAGQLCYRRNGVWNETTALLVETGGAPQPARRSAMEGLKLDQLPCQVPNTVVLKPTGSIDATTVHIVDTKLGVLASGKGTRIVVDMSEVDFVSSAGVGTFLGTVAQLRADGGDLIFMAMSPAVLEVFEILNLSSYFKFVGSLDELAPALRR